MKRRATIAFVGSLLALGLWSMTAYSATAEEEAQKAVLELVETMNGKKGDVKAQTQAIEKKFANIEPIMWVYKPRKLGGIGWGKDGTGIENELVRLGGSKSNPARVAQQKKELGKVADLSRAIAEINKLYDQKYPDDTGKLNPAKWKEYTENMSKAADELRKAAKGGDGAKIKRAVNNLNASCVECHGVFRS